MIASIGTSVTAIDTDATQGKRFALGTLMIDPATSKEYIYMQGAASTLQYDLVNYNRTTTAFATTRSAASQVGPCAVAQAAINATTSYGWYQVAGSTTINTGAACTASVGVYLHATAGSISSTGVGGDWVQGMTSVTAALGAGTCTVHMAYPFTYHSAYLT